MDNPNPSGNGAAVEDKPQVGTGAEAAPQGGASEQVNWETRAKEYEEKLKGYGDYDDYKTAAMNAYNFLQKYPELGSGYKSYLDGKEWQPNFAKADEPKKTPQFDEGAVKSILERELESRLTPLYRADAERQAKEEERIAKEKYGFSDEEFQKLNKAYADMVDAEAKELMFSEGISKKEALAEVNRGYKRFKVDQLIALLMPEKMASTKRTPQALPRGMASPGNNPGPSPAILEQARKEYESAPKGDASASVVKKWSEQLGLPMAEAHKILQGD